MVGEKTTGGMGSFDEFRDWQRGLVESTIAFPDTLTAGNSIFSRSIFAQVDFEALKRASLHICIFHFSVYRYRFLFLLDSTYS